MNSFLQNLIENVDLRAEGLWFPVAVSIVLLGVILFMRKRLQRREIGLIFVAVGYVAILTDIFFSFHLLLFIVGSKGKVGLGEVLCFGFVPSALAVVYLNYLRPERFMVRAFFFVLVSFLFEYALTKVGLMRPRGWKPVYSLPVYLGMYLYGLPWLLSVLRERERPRSRDYVLTIKNPLRRSSRIK